MHVIDNNTEPTGLSIRDLLELLTVFRIKETSLEPGQIAVLYPDKPEDPDDQDYIFYKGIYFVWSIMDRMTELVEDIAGLTIDYLKIFPEEFKQTSAGWLNFLTHGTAADTMRTLNHSAECEKSCRDHEDCFWCDYFTSFNNYVFSEEVTPSELIRRAAKDLAKIVYQETPIIVQLARFHLCDVEPDVIATIDQYVPPDLKRQYRRSLAGVVMGDKLRIIRHTPNGAWEDPEMEYNFDIGKSKPTKSA